MNLPAQMLPKLQAVADVLAVAAYRPNGDQRRGPKADTAREHLEAVQFAVALVKDEARLRRG